MVLVDFEQTDFWLDFEKKHTCLHLLAQNMIGVPYGVDFSNNAKITLDLRTDFYFLRYFPCTKRLRLFTIFAVLETWEEKEKYAYIMVLLDCHLWCFIGNHEILPLPFPQRRLSVATDHTHYHRYASIDCSLKNTQLNTIFSCKLIICKRT